MQAGCGKSRTFLAPIALSPMTDHQSIGLGLLGCGTVGQSFCQLIEAQRDEIERRTGLRLEVRRIAVRDTSKSREGVDSALLTLSLIHI